MVGYKAFNRSSKLMKYDGICVFVRGNIVVNRITSVLIEANMLLNCSIDKKKYKIFSMYQSPANGVENFINLDSFLRNNLCDSNMITVGVMNINIIECSTLGIEHVSVLLLCGLNS